MSGDFARSAENARTDGVSDADSDAKACAEYAQQVSRFVACVNCVGADTSPPWRSRRATTLNLIPEQVAGESKW
jgi:hypothetical protein